MSAVAASLITEDGRESSVGLVLHDVEAVAQRQGARVALMLIAGCTKTEIRRRLGLTVKEYGEVLEQLRACFAAE